MDFFFECFFEASRARWWQVLAAACIGATLAATVAWGMEPSAAHAARYAVGGGVLGLLAALWLLWIDAGQRMREARGETRLTLRERFMVGCLIFGFALGAFSLVCAAIMFVIRTIEFVSKL